jgi:hypothetical protein
MNNLYTGLLIIVSAVAGLFRTRKAIDFFLPATALFFFLISTNYPVSLWIIQKLPLLQYVRLNGELRIFGILPLLLYGAIQFDSLFIHHRKYLQNTCYLFAGVMMLVCISAILIYPHALSVLSGSTGELFGRQMPLKEIIHRQGFGEMIILQSLIQSILLLLAAICLTKKPHWLTWLAGADLIVATLLNLPFTGVSMRPVSAIQSVIDKSPAGFPVPSTGPEKNIYAAFPDTDTITGNWSFYSKQVAIDKWHPYPMLLSTTSKYFDSTHEQLKQRNTGFIFAEDSTAIRIQKFRPGGFLIYASAVEDTRLVIKQNLYPGWVTTVNNIQFQPGTAYYTFPSIPIKKGHNEISHEFRKPFVTFLFVIYWAALFALTTALLISIYHKRD